MAEEEDQLFPGSLQEESDVHCCVLFPQKYDLLKVCSCNECFTIIQGLKQFEEEQRFTRKRILEHLNPRECMQHICLHLHTAAEWTKKMLDLLQNNLNTLSLESEVSLTVEKSKSAADLQDLESRIAKIIKSDLDLVGGVKRDPEEKYTLNVPEEIKFGLYYYGKSKAKDAAHSLLRKIVEIEEEHKRIKKCAEADNNLPDPSISIKCLEDQIKCVKMLPVEELLLEVKELYAEIRCRHKHDGDFSGADGLIKVTCRCMIRIRNAFWRQYQASDDFLTSKGHNVRGLKETLVSLREQVINFEYMWKNYYCPFTPICEQEDCASAGEKG